MSSVRLIVCLLALLSIAGCALGKKEWPEPQRAEDRFGLALVSASRDGQCLTVGVQVTGAVDRLYRASIQFEPVGDGGGCPGCPFVPRDAMHAVRGQEAFDLDDRLLSLTLCDLGPGVEYRFRIAGKSELATMPLVYTATYTAMP